MRWHQYSGASNQPLRFSCFLGVRGLYATKSRFSSFWPLWQWIIPGLSVDFRFSSRVLSVQSNRVLRSVELVPCRRMWSGRVMAPSSDSFLEIEYLVRLEDVEVGMGLAISWGAALTVFQISKTGVVRSCY